MGLAGEWRNLVAQVHLPQIFPKYHFRPKECSQTHRPGQRKDFCSRPNRRRFKANAHISRTKDVSSSTDVTGLCYQPLILTCPLSVRKTYVHSSHQRRNVLGCEVTTRTQGTTRKCFLMLTFFQYLFLPFIWPAWTTAPPRHKIIPLLSAGKLFSRRPFKCFPVTKCDVVNCVGPKENLS
eukprot:g37024.t1